MHRGAAMRTKMCHVFTSICLQGCVCTIRRQGREQTESEVTLSLGKAVRPCEKRSKSCIFFRD